MINKTLSLFYHTGAVLLLALPILQAEEVTLEPSKDNTIYEEDVLSNGAGIRLLSGKTGESGEFSWRRALIQFDVSSAIPSGAVIESVTLSLNVSKVPPGEATASRAFKLHLMMSDWGEGTSDALDAEGRGAVATNGDATWLNAFHPSTPWTFAGADGDFVFTASASTLISGLGVYTWSSEGLVADVQGWVDSPETNFGWIILGPNVDQSARRFDSREHPTQANRPKLAISYAVPPTHWAGYLIESDGRTVITGDFIGIIDIANQPWVYVYDLQDWIYLPESHVTQQGGWTYIPK